MTTWVNGVSTNKINSAYTTYYNALGSSNCSINNIIKKNSSANKSYKNDNITSSSYGYNSIGTPVSKKYFTEKKKSTIRTSNSMKNGYHTKLNNHEEEIDKSRIETLFDDDQINRIENVGNHIQEFISQFRARYKEKFEENPEDKTQEGFKKIIEVLFELQEIYYQDYKKASSLNNILKSYLISYSENFRNLNKKKNRLNEMFESLAIRVKFAEDINRKDNIRISEIIDIHKREIMVFKNIFKLNYDQNLIEKYKEEMKSEKCILSFK